MRNAIGQLDSRDVAHILDMSPDDVIRLAKQNKIKAKKEGRLWRYHPQSVLAYQRKMKGRGLETEQHYGPISGE
jgi:hypothetical protein